MFWQNIIIRNIISIIVTHLIVIINDKEEEVGLKVDAFWFADKFKKDIS